MSSQLVNSAKTPRNTMSTRPGTRPTTASDDGSESIPLLTISAIMSTATSGHESVLYRIYKPMSIHYARSHSHGYMREECASDHRPDDPPPFRRHHDHDTLRAPLHRARLPRARGTKYRLRVASRTLPLKSTRTIAEASAGEQRRATPRDDHMAKERRSSLSPDMGRRDDGTPEKRFLQTAAQCSCFPEEEGPWAISRLSSGSDDSDGCKRDCESSEPRATAWVGRCSCESHVSLVVHQLASSHGWSHKTGIDTRRTLTVQLLGIL